MTHRGHGCTVIMATAAYSIYTNQLHHIGTAKEEFSELNQISETCPNQKCVCLNVLHKSEL